MMSGIIPLTGRDEEVLRIETLLKQATNSQVILITGDGGIGKTRLIQEIRSRSISDENQFITKVIDFDERPFSSPESLEYRIASEFGSRVTDLYLSQLQDFRKMESAGVSLEKLNTVKEEITNSLANHINEVTKNIKGVIFFDTLDKLDNDRTISRIKDLIRFSEKITFILAGRAQENRWALLLSDLNIDVKVIELRPLDLNASQKYIEYKKQQISSTLDPAIVDGLLVLTGGHPILIDLAIEHFTRDTPSEWMALPELEKLKGITSKQKDKIIKEFEFNLVKIYSEIRTDLDRLVLLMSRVFPLSVEMISELLNLSMPKAIALFDDAKSRVFVKVLPNQLEISLHDEMRRMITENLWLEIDPLGVRQRNDSLNASQYFAKRDADYRNIKNSRMRSLGTGTIVEFRDREDLASKRNENTEQWIYHALFSNVEEGFKLWEDITNKIRTRARNYFFAERLTKIANGFYNNFDKKNKFYFDVLNARLMVDIGKINEGRNRFVRLLAQNKGDKSLISGVYNALGVVELKSGNLSTALKNQIKCLQIIQHTNESSVPFVANQIGYIYRLQANLKKANEYYEMALKIENNKKDPSPDLVASLLNNIGYIYGLQKKYDYADDYCKRAMRKWLENGFDREASRAQVSLGIFCRDQRDYFNSINFLNGAISRCVNPDDHEILCSAYFHKGWTLFYQAEEVSVKIGELSEISWNESLMTDALASFLKSDELAKEFAHKADMPGILLLTGTVKWYLAGQTRNKLMREEARLTMDEAYRVSKEVGYVRYIIHSLTRKAEFDYEEENYENIKNYANLILDEYGNKINSFPLYFGRMFRIEGDVFLKKEMYQLATKKYAESIPLIKQHGGFGRYSLARELERFEAKLSNLDVVVSKKIVSDLRAIWTRKNNGNLDFLVKWCDLQLI